MKTQKASCFKPSCASKVRWPLAVFALSWFAAGVQAANVWDGGASDGLWASPANWDTDALPTGNPTFPFAAANKQVNLGGDRYHERVILQG
jgi:hypothetical protein